MLCSTRTVCINDVVSRSSCCFYCCFDSPHNWFMFFGIFFFLSILLFVRMCVCVVYTRRKRVFFFFIARSSFSALDRRKGYPVLTCLSPARARCTGSGAQRSPAAHPTFRQISFRKSHVYISRMLPLCWGLRYVL